ncbi:acetyl-CoA synthetase-like protein [Lenzites betulinus]|nr:acetyl-CoA synthetase-like protein [Lenzites betulinus]
MAEIHGVGGPLPYIPDDLTIAQYLLDTHHPLRPAVDPQQPWFIEETTGREIRLEELRSRITGLANAFKIRWNIGEDDVVCVFSPNHIDYGVAIWATHQLGGIVTTANPSYTVEEIIYQLGATKAKLIIVHPLNLAVALEAARAVGLSVDRVVLLDSMAGSSHANVDGLISQGLREPRRFTERRLKAGEAKTKLALLCFSSGTTGKPKAVMLSHYGIIANMIQVAQYTRLTDKTLPPEQLSIRPGSVTLAVLPFYHIFGMHIVLFGSLHLGSAVVVSQKFSLEQMLKSIQRYRITHLYLVPPMVVLLCKSPIVKDYDLSSVYLVMAGAAPLSADLTDQLVKLLPNAPFIGQGYGMTELSTSISHIHLDRKNGDPGSSGILLPGIVARVVKADGTLAGFNELGELHLRSPSMSLGYLNNPTATADTFKDGWLHTGDEVMINEKKEVFVVDRIKARPASSLHPRPVRGFQVAPAELEGHLLEHPDVVDACVIGIPDAYSGELPFAFVVMSPSAQAWITRGPGEEGAVRAAILKHVADHKVYYKRLAGIEFVPAIPKNPSGKLLRRVLRDQAKTMLAEGKLRLMSKSKSKL